eukprot:TRINITY_DN8561_c0_g1_i1.p1 TRINITY_DN8561_c0_g1~~TRINITY_DN8561_c0_g1_i1.p1  ORF type:complete len:214 (-),score=44.62 TRINITY_DN8561_c0_g1_i1:282-923(-)
MAVQARQQDPREAHYIAGLSLRYPDGHLEDGTPMHGLGPVLNRPLLATRWSASAHMPEACRVTLEDVQQQSFNLSARTLQWQAEVHSNAAGRSHAEAVTRMYRSVQHQPLCEQDRNDVLAALVSKHKALAAASKIRQRVEADVLSRRRTGLQGSWHGPRGEERAGFEATCRAEPPAELVWAVRNYCGSADAQEHTHTRGGFKRAALQRYLPGR